MLYILHVYYYGILGGGGGGGGGGDPSAPPPLCMQPWYIMFSLRQENIVCFAYNCSNSTVGHICIHSTVKCPYDFGLHGYVYITLTA